MADWLIETGIETVAMESTGVYWVAAYEVLESRGIDVSPQMHVKHARFPAERVMSMTPNGCKGSTRAGYCAQAFAPDVTLRRCACICVHVSAIWTMPPLTSSTCKRH